MGFLQDVKTDPAPRAPAARNNTQLEAGVPHRRNRSRLALCSCMLHMGRAVSSSRIDERSATTSTPQPATAAARARPTLSLAAESPHSAEPGQQAADERVRRDHIWRPWPEAATQRRLRSAEHRQGDRPSPLLNTVIAVMYLTAERRHDAQAIPLAEVAEDVMAGSSSARTRSNALPA